jgi:hypothetical protein
MTEVKKIAGGQIKDLTGQVFGRLTVVEQAGMTKHRLSTWLCKCLCGNKKIVIGGNLKTGTTTSCGCYSKEQIATRSITHGMSDTPEFYSWQDILKRCKGSTEKSKANYLDRGISVHPDFSESFEKFHSEIGVRPRDGQVWSVGRIDNNEDYTYGNIRWETNEQQSRNKTKRVDNKTGVTGVTLTDKCFVASCYSLDGSKITRSFSLRKYGRDKAFDLATGCREDMIRKLNEQGAGYSVTHGTDK